ncbi:NAD-dependent epimerase/dehydratase family protein [Pseudomonas juntendi]|uniref:NAD-dependent epimerase/dehydratase family protein n=1 Tax=Pseudomonas juntendi TaxID=2666183 RepID=UPI003208C4CB
MILVTGASGFIGRALCARLTGDNYKVRGAGRSQVHIPDLTNYVSCDLEHGGELDQLCSGVDTVIHLAGRAHVLKETSENPVLAFSRANVDVSVNLAQAAIRQKVRRFIFLSSIGVHAAESEGGDKISEASACAPSQLYGVTKLDAEIKLLELVEASDMELVIIRPPLVYAGDAPGNFHRLMSVISKGVPLPFANVHNLRSMIARENLIDFISLCITHPSAANEKFVVSDGVGVSTPEIVRCLAKGMGKSPKLFACPSILLSAGLTLIGRRNMYNQLCRSLVLDSRKAKMLLGWKPPVEPEQALVIAGRDFIKTNSDTFKGQG